MPFGVASWRMEQENFVISTHLKQFSVCKSGVSWILKANKNETTHQPQIVRTMFYFFDLLHNLNISYMYKRKNLKS